MLCGIYCTTISHFAHSYVEGYLGGFKFLATTNKVVVNIFAQAFLETHIFISLKYLQVELLGQWVDTCLTDYKESPPK